MSFSPPEPCWVCEVPNERLIMGSIGMICQDCYQLWMVSPNVLNSLEEMKLEYAKRKVLGTL